MDPFTSKVAGMPNGILAQVRAEARREERQHFDFTRRQISQCEYDEAFEAGREQAYLESPSRFRWFMFGVISLSAMSGLSLYLFGSLN
jgi:hypothetical protein